MARQAPSIQTDLLAALNAAGDVVYEWDVARDSLTWTGAVSYTHLTLPTSDLV